MIFKKPTHKIITIATEAHLSHPEVRKQTVKKESLVAFEAVSFGAASSPGLLFSRDPTLVRAAFQQQTGQTAAQMHLVASNAPSVKGSETARCSRGGTNELKVENRRRQQQVALTGGKMKVYISTCRRGGF